MGSGGRIHSESDLPQICKGLGLRPVGAMTPGRMGCASAGARMEGFIGDFFPLGAGETWTASWCVPSVWLGEDAFVLMIQVHLGTVSRVMKLVRRLFCAMEPNNPVICKECVLFHVFLSVAFIQQAPVAPTGCQRCLRV